MQGTEGSEFIDAVVALEGLRLGDSRPSPATGSPAAGPANHSAAPTLAAQVRACCGRIQHDTEDREGCQVLSWHYRGMRHDRTACIVAWSCYSVGTGMCGSICQCMTMPSMRFMCNTMRCIYVVKRV